MEYELIPIERLRALEQVFPNHLKNLKEMIYKNGMMKYAIIAERKHNIVLDGSHRHVFLAMENFKLAPVHYVDYENPHIQVGTVLSHRFLIESPTGISKKEVIKRGMSGNLFPPRTTRHFFPFRKTVRIDVPLSKLKKGNTLDVRSHIADVDIKEEIDHNKKYIQEIEEETDIIIHYLEEGRKTKKYLCQQVEKMEKQCKEKLHGVQN